LRNFEETVKLVVHENEGIRRIEDLNGQKRLKSLLFVGQIQHLQLLYVPCKRDNFLRFSTEKARFGGSEIVERVVTLGKLND